jgi:hypothetical protein
MKMAMNDMALKVTIAECPLESMAYKAIRVK